MISKGGKPQACPLVFNFQKALNIPSFLSFLIIQIIQITQNFLITPTIPNSPNVLNFPIILNSPITPIFPPTTKKQKKHAKYSFV